MSVPSIKWFMAAQPRSRLPPHCFYGRHYPTERPRRKCEIRRHRASSVRGEAEWLETPVWRGFAAKAC